MSEDDRDKWDARHAEAEDVEPRASEWLAEWVDIPGPRAAAGDGTPSALDVASGRGALSLWLSLRGYAVTAVDISGVALAQLGEAAARHRLNVRRLSLDLEHEALPTGPFDLITCLHFKPPQELSPLLTRLAPGGRLCLETATVHNLERHDRPSRRYLVQPDEWRKQAQAQPGFHVEHDRAEWVDGRHLSRVVVRRQD